MNPVLVKRLMILFACRKISKCFDGELKKSFRHWSQDTYAYLDAHVALL